jgi:hypothetical protein
MPESKVDGWWGIGILLLIVTIRVDPDQEKVESIIMGVVMTTIATIAMFSGVLMPRYSVFVRILYFIVGLLFLWANLLRMASWFPAPSAGEEIRHHALKLLVAPSTRSRLILSSDASDTRKGD